MGIEKNLLHSLPRSVRNISERIRTKDPEVTAISQNFGREYFDSDRIYGYGGYTYDGCWGAPLGEIYNVWMEENDRCY